MRSNIKRYVMPIMVTLLCIVMMFATVYCSVALTKAPDFTIDGGLDNGNNNITPPTQVAEKLPDNSLIKEVDTKYQVAPGDVPLGYENTALSSPVEIRTKSELQAWLLSTNSNNENDNGGVDAKLMANITFDWNWKHENGSDGNGYVYLNGQVVRGGPLYQDGNNTQWGYVQSTSNVASRKARIAAGRTLDGYGHTITFTDGNNDWIKNDNLVQCGLFTYEIFGTIMNTRFELPRGKKMPFTLQGFNTSDDYYGGIVTAYAQSGSLIDNVNIDIYGEFGVQAQTDGVKEYSTAGVGAFAGYGAGVIEDCQAVVKPGGIMKGIAYGGPTFTASTKKNSARCKLGGFVGQGAATGKIIRGIFDLSNNGEPAFHTEATLGDDKAGWERSGAAYGNQNAAGVEGFIARNMNVATSGFGLFVGRDWGPTSNLYVTGNDTYNWMSGDKPTIRTFTRIFSNQNLTITWDRAIADRIIFEQVNKGTNEIFWDFSQYKNGAVDPTRSVSDMYRYGLSTNKSYSIPAVTPGTDINTGDTANDPAYKGDGFGYNVGQVGTITSATIPGVNNKTVNYNGGAYPTTIVMNGPSGAVWNNSTCYKILYNGGLEIPVMPGTYTTTVRAANPPAGQVDAYAYFDANQRQLVWANDILTARDATLQINRGTGKFTATDQVTGQAYVDNAWTALSIKINLAIDNVNANMDVKYQPNTVKLTYATKAEQIAAGDIVNWFGQTSWSMSSNNGEYLLNRLGDGSTEFRFALFRGNIQITDIIDIRSDAQTVGILPKVDDIAPTLKLDDCHTSATGLRKLDKWMDSYTPFDMNTVVDDSQELSQVWFMTTAGPSALTVEVRKKRGAATEFDPWGILSYHPQKDGTLLDDNIFAQQIYDNTGTRAQNQLAYGGKTVLQVRAKNGAGAWATINATGGTPIGNNAMEFTVKADYNDYTLDPTNSFTKLWNGTAENLNAGCAVDINYPTGRAYFTRNEAMNFTVTASAKSGNNGFSIVEVGGAPVGSANSQLYKGVYNIPSTDTADKATITPTVINIQKTVFGSVGAIANQAYGTVMPDFKTKVSLDNASIGGVNNVPFTLTTELFDSKGAPVPSFQTSLLIPVGTYTVKVSATLDTIENNKKYSASVTDGSITVTQKEITVTFDKNTLSCSRRNFTDQWVKLDMVNFKTLLVEGDKETVFATSIYPIDPVLPSVDNGPAPVQAVVTLNSGNYKVLNEATVTLAKFLTDPTDPSLYLIQTVADFEDIKGTFLNSKFKQDGNIDFKGNSITPIGDFTGTYDGDGYKLANFKLLQVASKVGASTYNMGVFSTLKSANAEVKNLVIENAVVEYTAKKNAQANVGILVGSVDTGAKVINVMVKGKVVINGDSASTAINNVGIIAGSVAGASVIRDAFAYGELSCVNSMSDKVGANVNAGGAIGALTDSTVTNVNIFVQGNVSTTGGCNYLAGMSTIANPTTTPITGVKYLDKALNGAGVVSDVNIVATTYAQFLQDTTAYGSVIVSGNPVRGETFANVVESVIPSNMITAGDLTTFKVSSFKDLLTMTYYSWANYEIQNDIYCFSGYNFNDAQAFIGKITYKNNAKIIADNGIFQVGSAVVVTPDPVPVP